MAQETPATICELYISQRRQALATAKLFINAKYLGGFGTASKNSTGDPIGYTPSGRKTALRFSSWRLPACRSRPGPLRGARSGSGGM